MPTIEISQVLVGIILQGIREVKNRQIEQLNALERDTRRDHRVESKNTLDLARDYRDIINACNQAYEKFDCLNQHAEVTFKVCQNG
jgi:hypothetical protein